ncbi:MAG TPA: glycosyltransferase family 39 protein [Pirellulales bacterium]
MTPMQANTHDCRRLVLECFGLAALLAVYHLLLTWLMRHAGLELGAVGQGNRVVGMAPLYMYWAPRFKLSCLPAIAVLAGLVGWLAPWLVTHRAWSTWRVAGALVGCQLAVTLSVGIVDGGPRGLARPYHDLTATDYIGAVDRVASPRAFLEEYPRLIASLPMHCQTHPPGAVLFLWLAARLLGPGPMPAALATIFAAALSVPAVYLLARCVLEESRARLAACLYLLAPNVVLFSATSMDAVFAVPLIWTIYLVFQGSRRAPLVYGALAGLCAAVGALLTFSIAVLAVWGLVLLALDWRLRPDHWSRTCRTLIAAVVAALAFYALLYAWSGYDPVATFRAALAGHHRVMAGTEHETLRRHLHFVVANLVAFFAAAGIASTVLFGRALRAALGRDGGDGLLRPLLLSVAAAVLIVDLLPLYTLEVEHIWLFLVPWVTIAAASQLPVDPRQGHLAPVAKLALALIAAQTLTMELLLHTYW